MNKLRELEFKPDFEKTIQRFDAWWNNELLDRPPVSLYVKPTREYSGPRAEHVSIRDRWMDVEYVVDSAVAGMECTDFIGDAFPMFYPNVGPEISATLYGCELQFSETTSWAEPVVHDAGEWQPIIDTAPNFNNDYWQAIEAMTDYAIEKSNGRYIVGLTDLHGNYDILAALRDPEILCLDLMDCPDVVQQAGRRVTDGYVQSFERLYAKVAKAGMGSTTWLPTYYEGRACVPSCDFWCMVSDEMAREIIWPDILTEIAPLERSIFHLDGPQALRHLDLLLDLPQLSAVQWVFGEGHGPASEWIEVYKRIQAAGKGFQVMARDAQDALTVFEAIGPRGCWFTIAETFNSVDEAEAFLRCFAVTQ